MAEQASCLVRKRTRSVHYAGQGGEEGFHRRVVRAIGGSTHAHLDAQLSAHSLIPIAGQLAATIRMMLVPCRRVALRNGHTQGQLDQLLILGGRHGPAHHHRREQIQDHREGEPSLCADKPNCCIGRARKCPALYLG
jgi:hypothetical protein